MTASKCLRKWCQAYLDFLIKVGKESHELNSIPIIREFLDGFSKELPRLPLKREVEVSINIY
jgi:hypothetical protein